jgi:hypothetical protein
MKNNDIRPSRRFVERLRRPEAWWMARLREHPFKTASMTVLTVGGLMLLMLFAHIGSLPDLDLAGATATLAAVALIGLAVCICFAGSTLFAGLMLRDEEAIGSHLRGFWSVVVLIVPGLSMVIGLAIKWGLDPRGSTPGWIWWLPVIGSAVLIAVRLWRMARRGDIECPETGRIGRVVWWAVKAGGFFAVGCVWTAVAVLALLTLTALFPSSEGQSYFLLRLVVWTAACYAINVLVLIVRREKAMLASLIFGSIGLVMLVALSGNWPGIPIAAARGLGLAEMPVGLVVTRKGCAIANLAARGQTVCRASGSEDLALICPVMLRSRIGSPVVVELSAFDRSGAWPNRDAASRRAPVQIPKSEVLSWPGIDLLRAPAQSGSPASAASAVASYLDASAFTAAQRAWMSQQCGPVPAAGAASGGLAAASRVGA